MSLSFVDLHACSQCEAIYNRRDSQRFAGMAFVPTFDTAGELAYHQELVHGRLICPVCDFRYEQLGGRVNHMKKAHGLKTSEIRRALA